MGNEAETKSDPGRQAPFTPNEVSRRVGMNIKRLREAKIKLPEGNLTQGKMSMELWGKSASYMNQIEAGKKNLSLSKLIAIVDYFNVDIYELFLKPGITIIDREKK